MSTSPGDETRGGIRFYCMVAIVVKPAEGKNYLAPSLEPTGAEVLLWKMPKRRLVVCTRRTYVRDTARNACCTLAALPKFCGTCAPNLSCVPTVGLQPFEPQRTFVGCLDCFGIFVESEQVSTGSGVSVVPLQRKQFSVV